MLKEIPDFRSDLKKSPEICSDCLLKDPFERGCSIFNNHETDILEKTNNKEAYYTPEWVRQLIVASMIEKEKSIFEGNDIDLAKAKENASCCNIPEEEKPQHPTVEEILAALQDKEVLSIVKKRLEE